MTGLIRFSPRTHRAFAAQDFDRAIDSLTSHFFGDAPAEPALRADVAETDTAYVVRIDVPGAAKDAINIAVEDKLVKIEVNFAPTAVEGEKLLRAERGSGSASRALRFPVALDADAASAAHELGVLTLTLPKKAQTAQKRVTIN